MALILFAFLFVLVLVLLFLVFYVLFWGFILIFVRFCGVLLFLLLPFFVCSFVFCGQMKSLTINTPYSKFPAGQLFLETVFVLSNDQYYSLTIIFLLQ